MAFYGRARHTSFRKDSGGDRPSPLLPRRSRHTNKHTHVRFWRFQAHFDAPPGPGPVYAFSRTPSGLSYRHPPLKQYPHTHPLRPPVRGGQTIVHTARGPALFQNEVRFMACLQILNGLFTNTPPVETVDDAQQLACRIDLWRTHFKENKFCR
jgi:hypothetical protein